MIICILVEFILILYFGLFFFFYDFLENLFSITVRILLFWVENPIQIFYFVKLLL